MTSMRAGIRRITRQGTPFSCAVTVRSVTAISAGFTRIAAQGDGLDAYQDVLPADAFKLMLPPEGTNAVHFPERGADGFPHYPEGIEPPVLRAYTVREFDRAARRIDFDVALHGTGLAMNWIRSVAQGDIVGLAGMRREFHPGDGVDRQLIVADSSALPAACAIVESLDPLTPATVYLNVANESDADLLPLRPNINVHIGDDLERMVRAHERPGERIQAWLGAEASVVRTLRRFVLDELSVDRADLHAAAYWKAGTDGTQVDAVNLSRYQRVSAAGMDITDPAVLDIVEFEERLPGE